MFKTTKLKLTLWYLLILTVITVAFSGFVYASVVTVTNRALESQRIRLERRFNSFAPDFMRPNMAPLIDPETLNEVRERTLFLLVVVDLVILGVAGGLSYFLAGITLKPIEEMLKKQKRFVSDAAHELKTPLTSMKTGLEVTLRDKNLDLRTAKSSLSETVDEVDKLNIFVNKLLKQSKYQNGVKNYDKKDVRIVDVINSSVKDIKSLAAVKKIKLDIGEIETGLTVYADKESLQELFRNLLENAIKYSPENETVYLSESTRNNDVIIKIKDNGTGITEEDQLKIFDPFFRSDRSRNKGHVDGFGLGLAICKEIVEHHGGSVSVKSEVGKGSEFTVLLPSRNSNSSVVSQNI